MKCSKCSRDALEGLKHLGCNASKGASNEKRSDYTPAY